MEKALKKRESGRWSSMRKTVDQGKRKKKRDIKEDESTQSAQLARR